VVVKVEATGTRRRRRRITKAAVVAVTEHTLEDAKRKEARRGPLWLGFNARATLHSGQVTRAARIRRAWSWV
jgi:hypothetical protein